MTEITLAAAWDADLRAFIVRPEHVDVVAREIQHDERVVVTLRRPRSEASHRHYFARIAELWANLPEAFASAPYAMNPETLRKHALIATGYADVAPIVVETQAAAERVAAVIPSMHREYCVVSVVGTTVVVATAASQSTKAMGRKLFQKSKDDVLGWISNIVGVPVHEGEAS